MSLTAAVVALVVLLALYVTWTAGRLDRLHARVDAAWAALDAQLVRRAAAARACSPRCPRARGAARWRAASPPRWRPGRSPGRRVENDLSRALRAALPCPGGALPGLREELRDGRRPGSAWPARSTTRRSPTPGCPRRRLVRALHLAGHRALPQHFDIDTDAGT